MHASFPKGPKIIGVRWGLPGAYWIKLNTYGVALGSSGLAGGAGIFTNSKGFVKDCFSVLFGKVYAFETELLASMHALECAKDRLWTSIWLESDSMYVVNILSARSSSIPWISSSMVTLFEVHLYYSISGILYFLKGKPCCIFAL